MSTDGHTTTERRDTSDGSTRRGTRPTPESTPRTGDGRARSDGRSVPDLLRELSGEGADLVRQEVALAKAEMSEKLAIFQRNTVSIAVGGAFLLAALLFAVWAVNTGVTALLAQFMGIEIAVWLSPLILGVILAAVGWGMIRKGASAIGDEGLVPHQTKRTLEDDKRWASSRARQMKEEMKHG